MRNNTLWLELCVGIITERESVTDSLYSTVFDILKVVLIE